MKKMADKLMHAVQYDRYGGGAAALKHARAPIPSPKSDEVLIKVEAISLNAVDRKMQRGVMRPFFPRKFPFIPATDVAGEVIEVGAAVEKFRAGDKVLAILHYLTGGALAEFAVAKESLTVSRPPEVSAPDAAGVLMAGLTAYQVLTKAGGIPLDPKAEQVNILVTAASGGVGHYVVQLAKLGNTHVTATCGARNIEFVKSLGADEVLDYKTPEGSAFKSPSGKKYDFVIHCAENGIPFSKFESSLAENGKVIEITPGPRAFVTSMLKKLTLSKKQLVTFIMSPKGEDIAYLVRLMKEGRLKTVIDSKHNLSKAEDGWAICVDGHATGKIIVEP